MSSLFHLVNNVHTLLHSVTEIPSNSSSLRTFRPTLCVQLVTVIDLPEPVSISFYFCIEDMLINRPCSSQARQKCRPDLDTAGNAVTQTYERNRRRDRYTKAICIYRAISDISISWRLTNNFCERQARARPSQVTISWSSGRCQSNVTLSKRKVMGRVNAGR